MKISELCAVTKHASQPQTSHAYFLLATLAMPRKEAVMGFATKKKTCRIMGGIEREKLCLSDREHSLQERLEISQRKRRTKNFTKAAEITS